ncbi:MAG: SDR family NAD(P)-dependent oxidoreductase [Alphaproteobacteria bacterium]|nr:SDR family NAD(P)-dependent oxidoreductase [Alphaproteobacteria bacterium]MCB9699755.1 SDR family NAD(P)-dependent oxidoreductase [Alphaproteobacteria bacterium]
MQIEGKVALVTGASRGLGLAITSALAKRGARLVLAARDGQALEGVVASVRASGGVAEAVPTDLEDADARDRLVREAEERVGPIDLLVNNAGLESIARYEEIDPLDLDRVITLNLTVPMQLVRRVLPGMLERGSGHVVNVASLAGLAVMAHNEAYSASKFGLVGFTRALRASLQHEKRAVSASAVCPGFVTEVGMFANQQREQGATTPAMMGATTPERVAEAVVRATERDLPEVIVAPGPMRPMLAMAMLAPSLGEWLSPKFGANAVAETVVGKGGVRPR